MNLRNVRFWGVGVLLVVLLAGCATRNSLFADVDKNFDARDYKAALARLESKDAESIYPEQDKVLRQLDLGMLSHFSGDDAKSSQYLDEAERLIEENFTKSITEAAGSFLLNDTVMAYPGEAYEDIYLNAFKALNYSRQGQFDGAFVEIRRMGDKLTMLEDKYAKLAEGMNANEKAGGEVKAGKAEFSTSALAHFLSMVLYRADGKPDDAAIELKKVYEAFDTQKHVYDFAKPNLDKMLQKSPQARLTLVAFTGRAPSKKARTYRINTGNDTVSISMEQENSSGYMQTTNAATLVIPGAEPGYNFKCQVPYLETLPSLIHKVDVEVDGVHAGSLALLERMDSVAMDTFSIKEPLIYAKTIIRTVVKGIAGVAAKEGFKQAGVGGFSFLTDIATDLVVEASEQADLRSGRFFPGRAWVGDMEIPAGSHEIRVIYKDKDDDRIFTENLGTLDVKAKGLNLVPSFALM